MMVEGHQPKTPTEELSGRDRLGIVFVAILLSAGAIALGRFRQDEIKPEPARGGISFEDDPVRVADANCCKARGGTPTAAGRCSLPADPLNGRRAGTYKVWLLLDPPQECFEMAHSDEDYRAMGKEPPK